MLNNPQANYVQRGESIDFTNNGSSDIKANDVVALANRIGVAGCDIPVGATGSINVLGVYDMPADTATEFAVGEEVYWDGSKLTATATDNTPAGWVVMAKPAATTIARVKIG
ncbi:DUF2190 family protein [Gracilibacillus oryzae]|uniref:DUF2190 family protein n=1 Tax=Gracilibacillus oryzae TaxID=1672701 RepID=A0A7C8GR22_9BACI|nr:DUF2190 family protein [Gracilibacillus oryzae]KAB8126913.1 DUF2190 family protein [Gracilibacillus oryzae]